VDQYREEAEAEQCALRMEIPSTFEGMSSRGHAIPQVADWWLEDARAKLRKDARDQRSLGKVLAAHIKRRTPFQQSTLSRFIAGTHPVTYELILAIGAEYPDLAPPIIFPSTREEARAIEAVLKLAHVQTPGVTPIRKARAIAKTKVDAAATRAVDETPAEVAIRKRHS
jgi:hypothetical protein